MSALNLSHLFPNLPLPREVLSLAVAALLGALIGFMLGVGVTTGQTLEAAVHVLHAAGHQVRAAVCLADARPLATAALTAALVVHFGLTPALLPMLLFGWTLLALALIDLRTQWLPDALTLPLLWGGLLVNLNGLLAPLPDAVAGAAAGYLLLAGVNAAYRRLRGSAGKLCPICCCWHRRRAYCGQWQ